MSFLVVENKRLELDRIAAMIRNINPNVRVISVPTAEEALELSHLAFDVAFINAELDPGKMNGIELAVKLKSIHKDTHIIFITKSPKYMKEAFTVHADAYLMNTKKLSEEDIRKELDYITYHYPSALRTTGKIYMQTFGGFSVFLDGRIIEFERSLAKELLALLVDRRGIPVTAREACATLFEDKPYDDTQNGYYHVLVNSLMKTLGKNDMTNIIVKTKSYIAVNPNNFECDAYSYLKGDPTAARQYRGDYLSCYGWAVSPAADMKS